jgi:cyanate permease
MKMTAGAFLFLLFFGFFPWVFFSYLPWWAAIIINLGVSGLVLGIMVNAGNAGNKPQSPPTPVAPDSLSELLNVDDTPKLRRYH